MDKAIRKAGFEYFICYLDDKTEIKITQDELLAMIAPNADLIKDENLKDVGIPNTVSKLRRFVGKLKGISLHYKDKGPEHVEITPDMTERMIKICTVSVLPLD